MVASCFLVPVLGSLLACLGPVLLLAWGVHAWSATRPSRP